MDLHDQPLFDESFAKLSTMRSRGRTTVTLPFQISMKDIAKQVEDVVAEESVRVTLRGQVVPEILVIELGPAFAARQQQA